ncbi:TonB-dependent siderophore receptor [Candidatus Nitrotoga sp. 1052]|uniref:TonB-dependent siderophore receptor n=1 Tax=Candidatus Nitrotoga sp. 1052 TaxID=2886964 RepID=UPI001EF746CB|nr:TonB-dependent siderophore receptor [Candidatus Nitrotoga sp. 1052]CAH1075425.1 Ferrichrome-iron receptor [Candidatus Nitrotoga sp. 1052]
MQLRLSILASALSLAFSVSQASAQTSGQAEPDKELPVVTVSAERTGSFKSDVVQVGTFRDMAPIDVPQTSNVVTREVLDSQADTTLFGALRNTAGVTRSQLSGSTYDNIAIRGILVENRNNYRLNGSLPIINLIDIPLENKERVEVLKGASSLYYGFVPPSGIVNMVTKRAGNNPVSNISLMANQFGGANVHVDLGRRYGTRQQFGVRVNLVKGREDIGIDNFSGDRSLASGAFDWRASDKLSFKLDLEHYRKNVSEQAAIAVPAAVNGTITLPGVPDNRLNLAGEWQKYDAKATNLLFRTDYVLSENWGLLFEAGKARTERDRNFSQFQNFNLTTGQGTLRTFFARGQEWENKNYRAELYGRLPGQLITHELTFGYTANERSADPRTQPSRDVAQNLYTPVAIAQQFPTSAFASIPSTIKDNGLYLTDRVLIGEKWQATLGVRASNYESVTTTTRYEADGLNPQLSLMYKPVKNVSIYTSYLEGREESGQAPANRANAGELLAPALSKQKEIGMKAEIAKGILLQAAYFDITRSSTTVDSSNRFVLNGLAQYKGVELAASGEVTKQLSLIASALFMDAKQLNAANAGTFGKIPDNTPERTASLFSEYRLQSVPGLALSGGLYYVGNRPVNNENQAFVDGYTTVSLGVRHNTVIAGQRTTFQAVLDNAANRNYWSTAGNGLLGVGAPRMLKIIARMQF